MNETRKQGYIRTETVPTQVQIEAAGWLVCPNETVRCQKLCGRCLVKTRKILTAAAEVGRITVGDHKDLAMVENLRDEVARLKDERAATIERCAQVVKELADQQRGKFGCKPYTKARLEDAVAAIRALKDKP